jgi:hypothetical protein
MTRLVLLQCPLGHLHILEVLPGAATIEAATGLKPNQASRLTDDDKDAIWEVMRDE